jgi:cytosol alanyl aminopeptidase
MRAALLASLLLVASCGKPAMTAVAPADPDGRGEEAKPEHALTLPEGVELEQVALRLRVDPGAEEVSGTAALTLRFHQQRAQFFVHAEGLEIARAALDRGDSTIQARLEETSVEGVMRVRLASAIGPGEAILRIEYRAPFSDSLEGIYSVKDGAGRYALTQMQPIAARRVFPSFDQMSTKVPYALTLEVPERMLAVANTEVKSRGPLGDGFDAVTFARTPPLPSYLVAFAVGPFDAVTGTPLPPTKLRQVAIPLRGLATRGRGIELRYALAHVKPSFEALESYFGRPAPVEKLDMLAAPDFWAGAMENPGLFLFRDSILLLPAKPDAAARRIFALVMAHELAHLWFGNLVTPSRFEDLWLNEAFATHLSYSTLAKIHPEHRADILRAKSANRAKEIDALEGARAVRRPIESVHDVKSAFDAITYEKGAALLHAYESYLGEEALREAITSHIEANENEATDTEAFLDALSRVAPAEVVTSLRAHLERAGVPELRFSLRCERSSSSLRVEQLGEDRAPYPVAACVRIDGERRCQVFDERESSLGLSRCPTRVEPNADGAGYYRAVLEDTLFESYRARSLAKVGAPENVVFFGDATSRFRGGELDFDRYLSLLRTLGASSDEALASLPIEPLRFLHDEVAAEDGRAAIADELRTLYLARFGSLGFESGPNEEADRARDAIGGVLLGRVRDAKIEAQAVERARAVVGLGSRRDPEALAPGIFVPTVSLALESEGEPLFDALVARFRTTVAPSERLDLLRGVGSVRDPALAKRALELAFDPAVRRNEAIVLLGAQLARRETRSAAFDFLVERWDALVQKLGPSTAGSLASLSAYACDEEQIRSLKAALEPRAADVPGGPRFLETGLARAKACVARVSAERAALQAAKR